MGQRYWLMKTEPSLFSIDDFKKCPQMVTPWEGVRNYQARNFMREMKRGDLVFIYHSNTEKMGIAGLGEIDKEAYPDSSAWDKKSPYFDQKSTPEKVRWDRVDVKFAKKFKNILELAQLRQIASLKDLLILKKGNRLSVTPVSENEYQEILKAAH